MSLQQELLTQRRNTVAFIAANARSVALTPQETQRTTTGGTVPKVLLSRDPQFFRLIDQTAQASAGNQPGKLRTADGVERQVTHQLIGYHTAIMRVGDYWLDNDGSRYEVVELLPYNNYERRAKVVHYGG